MFDVFFALVLLRAVFVTARGRSRAGLAASLAAAILWSALAVSGWYGRQAETIGFSGALLLIVFGPSAVPGRTDRVPLSAILAAHPVAARLVIAAALVAGFAAAWRHAGRISPLSDEAVRRKDVALAILVPALLVTVQIACIALAAMSSAPF